MGLLHHLQCLRINHNQVRLGRSLRRHNNTCTQGEVTEGTKTNDTNIINNNEQVIKVWVEVGGRGEGGGGG